MKIKRSAFKGSKVQGLRGLPAILRSVNLGRVQRSGFRVLGIKTTTLPASGVHKVFPRQIKNPDLKLRDGVFDCLPTWDSLFDICEKGKDNLLQI